MFVVLVSYLERYSSSMMLISIISKACLLPSTDSTLPNMMLAFQEKKNGNEFQLLRERTQTAMR